MTRLKAILPFVVLAAFIALPVVSSDPLMTQVGVYTLVFAGAATAWNIFAGYTGYIALGHAAFFGIGCYTIAIICLRWHIPGGWEPFLLVPVAGVVAGLLALPVGIVALRTRRHTFVVITIAIFFIFQLLAFNLRGLTAGSSGLDLPIPPWSGDQFYLPFYYVSLAILVVAFAVSWWVRRSKYGLSLLAIRDDEDRARGLGVNTGLMKLSAFVISAIFVGMVGAVWAYALQNIYPQFAFDATFDVAIALIGFMGGLATLWGPIIGALILIPAQQYLVLYSGASDYYLILYGVLFLAVILLLPEGIVPTLSKRWQAWRARSAPRGPGPTALPAREETSTPETIVAEKG
jgi:branched-chain amino acid transport system permease protein